MDTKAIHPTRYRCGNRCFATVQEASDYASKVFRRKGIILGIDAVKPRKRA